MPRSKTVIDTQFETDDPNRIQDVGWTFKEVWRRSRGFVVTSLNLTIFFILWEIATVYGDINQLFLPKASDMFGELLGELEYLSFRIVFCVRCLYCVAYDDSSNFDQPASVCKHLPVFAKKLSP